MTSLLLLATLLADPPPVATTPHLSPAQERASFKVPDGFEVQLVAAEPDIAKPINMAFDARGRLWVTCTVEYPYEAPEGKGRDTVKVLSDFGPDGRARKVETFADGLNIPIGILPYQDGAIVYSIPNIWMLRDTDGDGKCDKREVLYSGFGHRDTHGMVNGFFHGFDGWVYACHGYLNDSKVKGKDGHEITMNSGNVFRFRPDGSRVELFAKGQVNPFGSCMDKWGNLYTACCHSKPITLVLRGACYESFGKPHDGLGFGPAMVHEYRGSTALCGLAWYEADHFPKPYQECFYLGDVVNNCVNRFTVTWKGATPTAKQAEDFLTSTDPWFRPCDIKLGPDGALYVADFYNRIIGHYEVPLGHPGRDRTSGRIWRIVHTERRLDVVPDRTRSSVSELLEQLEWPNLTGRLAALHQLQVFEPTPNRALIQCMAVSASEFIRAGVLWVLPRSERTSFARRELRDVRKPLLRVHAMRVLGSEPVGRDLRTELSLGALDHDAEVMRIAVEALGAADSYFDSSIFFPYRRSHDDPVLRHVTRMAIRNALEKNGNKGVFTDNEWPIVADVACAIQGQFGAQLILEFLKDRKPPPLLTSRQVEHVVRFADWNDRKKTEFVLWLEDQTPASIREQHAILTAALAGQKLRGEGDFAPLEEWRTRLAKLAFASERSNDVIRGIEVGRDSSDPEIRHMLAHLALNRSQPAEVRVEALPLAATSLPADVGNLLGDATEPLAIRVKAALALGGVNTDEARAALVNALPSASSRLAPAIATGLAGAKRGAEVLCDAVENGQASPRLLLDPTVRLKLDAAGLKDRVTKLTQGLPPADQQLDALIAKRRAGFAAAKPDAALGKEIFTKNCAICHQVGGTGAKIGPQLDGIGSRGLDRLLEDVMDPNRNVDPAFRATTLQLNDGRTLSGLLLREEGATVVLADNDGKEVVVRKDQIEERSVSPVSAMPAKFGEQMPEAELQALMAYLLTLKK